MGVIKRGEVFGMKRGLGEERWINVDWVCIGVRNCVWCLCTLF